MDLVTVTDVIPEYPNSEVAFYRRDGTFTLDEAFPSRQQSVMTDEDGAYSIDLWPNAEGLSATTYLAVYPGKDTVSFVLPASDSPITMAELREQEAWAGVPPTPTAIAIERARYASTTPGLGPDLIGYQVDGDGAVAGTVRDKLDQIPRTPADFGAVGDGSEARAAVQSSLNATVADADNHTNEIPAGEYLVNTETGSGRDMTSLSLIGVDGLYIKAQPGAKFLFDSGSHGRGLIIRDCTNIIIEGLELTDISDRTAGVGINIENSSNIIIRNCLIDGFGSYGIGITEATNTFGVTSSLISFSGHTITGPAGMFSDVVAPCIILVLNSALNNGKLHATAVAVDGSTITVTEDLVTEAAGTTFDVLVNNSFTFSGDMLSVTTADLRFLDANDTILLAGCSVPANNGPWPLIAVDDVEGLSLNIDGEFAAEGPGANITLTRVGKASISVLDAAACDDITIENCIIRNCGRHGIEDFAKALSKNHWFLNNTIEYCGLFITSGSAMKPGQSCINTLVEGNTIRGCQMGINPGTYANIRVIDNTILNCPKYGIAITLSTHVRGVEPSGSVFMMEIHHNTIAYTTDELTGNLYETPTPGYGAINVNGLNEDIGLLDIAFNTIMRWGHSASGYGTLGIAFNNGYVPFPNIKIRNNLLIDTGGIRCEVLTYTCTTVNGSTTLSAFTNTQTGRTGPGGLYKLTQLVGPGIPAAARVLSVNYAAGTIELTLPATAPGVAVAVRSARPYGLLVEDNEFQSTNPVGAGVVQVASDAGIVRRNTIRGFVAYGLQVLGSTFTVDANRIIEPNRAGVVSRSAILLGAGGDTGVYMCTNNWVDLGLNGVSAFIVNATNVGSWTNYNNRATTQAVLPYDSGSVAPLTPFWFEGTRLITLGLAAPTTGAWSSGYEVRNMVPNRFSVVRAWLCVASGSPGTWISVGGVGVGTTAQRPTPTISEMFFYKNTTTNTVEFWTGTAWKTAFSIA